MAEPLNLDTTYEELMSQKLEYVGDIDKRETSLVHIATAANSAETIQMLVTLKNFVDMVFADTAPREYLIRRAAERGLKPYEATKAQLKGVFNIDVPIGSRFNLDELNYIVKKRLGFGEYVLECETVGTIGNSYLGTLIPIEYIEGLTTAELTEILVNGEDEEDTELFRKRYFDDFDTAAFGGNRKDYKEKVSSLNGVGGVRVYRAWNGAGTVKLVIIDSEYNVPSTALIQNVQNAIDPTQDGEGDGLAPIDHVVTVVGADKTTINVSFSLSYLSGYNWATVENAVLATIDAYFKELAADWANSEDDFSGVVVRISQLETRILQVEGVLDITNTKLNGGTSNIQLIETAIAVRGVVSA